MSYTYVIGWVSDISDYTCDDGKRGLPHGDDQSLQANCVRMQAMHWILISHCIVGVLLFQNNLMIIFFQCDWMWTCYPIHFYWDKYLVCMYVGHVCAILCMPPRIVYKNPPHNADLPCPCQPAGSPVRVKWLMIQIQIEMQMQMQRKHMEKHTGCFF